jgi:hypothetical protein
MIDTRIIVRNSKRYKALKLFSEKGAGFVTRIKDNAVYRVEEDLYIDRFTSSR